MFLYKIFVQRRFTHIRKKLVNAKLVIGTDLRFQILFAAVIDTFRSLFIAAFQKCDLFYWHTNTNIADEIRIGLFKKLNNGFK